MSIFYDISSYLPEDGLINLSLVSSSTFFIGSNNLKYKRFIPQGAIESSLMGAILDEPTLMESNANDGIIKREIKRTENKDRQNYALVLYSIKYDNVNMFKFLVNFYQLDVNANFKCSCGRKNVTCKCESFDLLLRFAVTENKARMVDILIELGADVNLLDVKMMNKANNVVKENINWLSYNKIRVDGETFEEKYGLKDAVYIYKRLFESTINIQERTGNILYYACKNDNTEIVASLIRANYYVFLEYGTNYNKALLEAVKNGNVEIVKMLIDAGANIKVVNSEGQGVIITSAINSRLELLKMFIDMGIDVNEKDYYGTTVLDHRPSADIVILETLINAGIEFYVNNEIIQAIILGVRDSKYDEDFVRKYINTQDKDGNTVLHFMYAKKEGSTSIDEQNKYEEFIQIFIKLGANPNIKNNKGVTPTNFPAKLSDEWLLELSGTWFLYEPI